MWVVWLDDGGKNARGSVGQRVKGERSNGCKGCWSNGPVATGSDGCLGLGQSARLKGTWVGSQWVGWDREGIMWREDVQRERMEINTGGVLRAN